MYFYVIPSKDDAQHHGVLGMKWGIRRYQNKDGSLTARGKRRLGIGSSWNGVTKQPKYIRKNTNQSGLSKRSPFTDEVNLREVNKILKDTNNCSLCTFAFDLRNRGIDVRAGGSNETFDGKNKREIQSWYEGNRSFTKNAPYENEFNKDGSFRNPEGVNARLSQYDKIFKKQILNQGEGTSGHLTMQYLYNKSYSEELGMKGNVATGHDVFYKVENGDVYIYDAQSGKKTQYDIYFSTGLESAKSYNPKVSRHVNAFMRTDDLKPRTSAITTGFGIDEDGNRNGIKVTTRVAENANTPKYNYSPSTISELNTRPMNYEPPYKSKSEFELIIEDVSDTYNKLKKKVNNTVLNVKNGLNKLKNTMSNFVNTLSWKIF